MNRPLIIALSAIAVLVIGGLLALVQAVRSADAETQAAERIRLALWRLETRATALVVAEAAVPPEAYHRAGESPVVSPPRWLHVEVDGERIRSPQAEPSADSTATGLESGEAASRLAQVRSWLMSANVTSAGYALPALSAPAAPVAPAAPQIAGMPAGDERTADKSRDDARSADGIMAERTAPVRSLAKGSAGPASKPEQSQVIVVDETQASGAFIAAETSAIDRRWETDSADAAPEQRQRQEEQWQAPTASDGTFPSVPVRNSSVDYAKREEANSFAQNQVQRKSVTLAEKETPAKGKKSRTDVETDRPVGAAAIAKDATRSGQAPSGASRKSLAEAKASGQIASGSRSNNPTDGTHNLIGPLMPGWLGGGGAADHRLALRRELTTAQGRTIRQYVVLDWQALVTDYQAAIADLLPEARLVPASDDGRSESYRLASLPIALIPGEIPAVALRPATRWTLLGAVLGTAIGLAGAFAVALASGRLAARRAAFVSAVTHELRTPLTGLRLHADLLADPRIGGDPARREARIAVLRSEAGRLAHLVENVLDYARLERRPPVPAPIALADLLAPLRPRLAERLALAGLQFQADPIPDGTVRCDPPAVERLLANLADNAAKYATGTPDPTVALTIRILPRQVELHLRDHGPGLADDVRRRLFTPFARSAEAAAGSAPGVGLGLALCRRLARAQGGDLRLETPADGGVDAVVVLRLA